MTDDKPLAAIERNADAAIGYRLRCPVCRWDVTNTWSEHRCPGRAQRSVS